MRVTRIPGDFYDIGDKTCRVFCNEAEIHGWTVADDFRRVVETPGKVHHGAVRIDLAQGVKLPDDAVVTVYSEAEAQEILTSADANVEGKGAVVTKAKPKHIPARKLKAGK